LLFVLRGRLYTKNRAKLQENHYVFKEYCPLILMWIRIRAVIVDEPLAAEHLATLLDETCQVEVIGSAADSEAGLDLCVKLRPDAVFLETSLPGRDGVSLARQLVMLPQAPRLVFTTGNPNRATDAFRLKAVDYLLKPLDPGQVDEAVNRLLAYLRPFESDSLLVSAPGVNLKLTQGKMHFTGAPDELLPVRDIDRGKIRFLTRREVAAVIRRERHTWVHTSQEEFGTNYPLARVMQWVGSVTFIQIARHATVNLYAIAHIIHYGTRLYRVRIRDRVGSEITASRSGVARLAAMLKRAKLG
jgi:DNA-binding LytR/AlgR family response regulator